MINKIADNWIEASRKHKMFFVENTDRGDAPPMVAAERKGKLIAQVIAPQVDKNMALYAANLFRVGADADALTIVLDAHVAVGPAADKYIKKPGSMQKACDKEGACERGEISDCLVCHRVTVGKKGELKEIQMSMMQYDYHGKDGKPFRWIDQTPMEMGGSLEGYIIDSLKNIMSTAPQNQKMFSEMGYKMGLTDKDKILFHTTRAVIQVLAMQQFIVIAAAEYVDP